ncbi:aldehyde dehydrogenase family protein [Pseudomonas petrae]|uniref:aldehyde dehydrogenase (NAD(+)) n=1 Tax=Pseudomonas petrae TaxID=2912190 RepID=A0ABS9IEE8_9PSED|nr:aldehyde dehydrogenase family protein [Pseudomonas petrae]MCF7545436.1 aldehyde dehydrogenase family protein [Pseudomonas petrae]
MNIINSTYIDGHFVTPQGTELFALHNAATGKVTGQVRFGDQHDTRTAIAAAKRAFPGFSKTTRQQRIDWLNALGAAVKARSADLTEAAIQEYGAPVSQSSWIADYAVQAFELAVKTLKDFPFTQQVGSAQVTLEPLGVVGIITPWNANATFICSKLAMVIASGSTCVVKPSELSAHQTQVLVEALHEAGLPQGVFNLVNGRGEVVGAELSAHRDIAKISFTGSTATGKAIARAGVETMKRVTLELGGKSPTVLLEDADLNQALPLVLAVGLGNNGQSCIAGTRILVPRTRLAEFEAGITAAVQGIQSGDPRDPTTAIGPMVSQRQWDRVQSYIRTGIAEGATLLVGGEGRPQGTEGGWFVKPTVFSNAHNDMIIAREEIFGPVLTIIPYDTQDEAIEIANDTDYGLHAYVFGVDPIRTAAVADAILAGRVMINAGPMEPMAPFGGFKQSGLGRENGVFGLQAFLEPKAVMGKVG